jgi:hypothetical protein
MTVMALGPLKFNLFSSVCISLFKESLHCNECIAHGRWDLYLNVKRHEFSLPLMNGINCHQAWKPAEHQSLEAEARLNNI